MRLDGFESLGWTSWLTCDRRATGGWATDTALYAVMPRYKGGLQSNEFKAVLLTHEAQHFSDKTQFKAMQSWELEYRAKLAELWAADEQVARERLEKFAASVSDDKQIPHSYANTLVLQHLTEQLGHQPSEQTIEMLHQAAEKLLKDDTQKRLTQPFK